MSNVNPDLYFPPLRPLRKTPRPLRFNPKFHRKGRRVFRRGRRGCLSVPLLYLPAVFSFSFSVCVRMSRIQSPSEGVGNWQVLVVTTATAGAFSPVRGVCPAGCGGGGKR